MRRTKTLTSLVAAVVLALALGGYAYADPLRFESDLSEDGVVNVCNPDKVRAGRVAAAVAQWNAVSAQWGTPTLRQVSGTSALDCEVTVEDSGDTRANFYARVVFEAHPDSLQISDRFTQLPAAQKQATITHEFGHVLGLQHPSAADATLCAQSVMTTTTECDAVGVERRSTPGPRDEADLLDYWVEEPIYPVKNKCWADVDADGNNVCDDFGPPRAGSVGASSRAGGVDGGRQEGTGDPSSAVGVPDVIRN